MARILIIDDDSQLLKMLEITLTRNGHEVLAAANGKIGISILKNTPCDIVVTDIVMPEMDGIEVISEMVTWPHRPAIIAMSGGSQRLDVQGLLRIAKLMKVDVVIPKPITPLELIEAVKRLQDKMAG